ncbi:MAG: thioredoxin domain-containing protein [Nitrospirae bacterium]|nr:thioredoxin domain-containing protein [Nitrospirota bacterium]
MKKGLLFVVLFLFLMLPLIHSANAADSSKTNLENEIKSLKKDMQDLKKEVETLKTKIAAAPSQPSEDTQDFTVSIDDDPFMGKADAPVTIVEFSDYQCPFCGRFVKNTLHELTEKYIDTGKVKYVFRDFPLDFHKNASKAAEAANCAGDKGKYWEMHDKLFNNQTALTLDDLRQYARDIGLDADSFNTCLDSGKHAAEITKDLEDGRKAMISGTPSFIIGKTQSGKKEIVGKKIIGARPFSSFEQAIDQLLSEQGN